MVLTTLIITVPPLATSFFQGTLDQCSPYSRFGAVGKDLATGRLYKPQSPSHDSPYRGGDFNAPIFVTQNDALRQPSFSSDASGQTGTGRYGPQDIG